ncbi:MAG: carbohydrate binding family 9 domain-containing protein [Pyrinomonadaceae bacterium]|nr:carbohydrate binding family 9 domain-containing protein [Pyrinomonadaceae bacterium]
MKNLFAVIIILFLSIFVFSQPPAIPSGDTTGEQNKSVSESLVNVVRKPATVPKFSASPVIDGKLDDEIWKSAVVLKDLIQTGPGDNITASKPTEVYLGYDEKNLYIAFKCWDEKDKIRATVAQRDSVFGEDNVRFWLDTYDDKRRAYVFGVNPLGIQQDGLYTEGQGADFNVDILFESKGVIEDWGWSVEIKIPFKSLRYVAGKGKFWGFNAARNIDRLNDEFDSWVPLPRNVPGFLNQFGKITGLDEIKAERTLEIIPTLTVKETGKRVSQNKFSNPPIEPDFGFTAKYSITPNVTLDAAYNPDFADTEADAPVVEANQRFPIFFSEKRPFFLEGIDIFNTRIQAVYTRRIENPDVAVKLSGKIGKNTFGILAAQDDPLSNPLQKKALAGIVRFKRDFGEESNIGFLATHYSYPQKHNTVGGFDYRWKINKHSEFRGQILGSNSRNYFYNPNIDDSEYKTGNAITYDYNYFNIQGNFTLGFGGRGATSKYRADLGFTQRTNTNQIYTFLEYNSKPKPKSFIIQRFINTSFGIRNDFSGRLQNYGSDFNFNATLKGNTQAGFGGYLNKEILVEDEFGPKRNSKEKPNQVGAFFGQPTREAFQGGMFGFIYKRFNKRIEASINLNYDINAFDYDFGSGRKFPRVSPGYLLNQNNPALSWQIDPGTGKQFGMEAEVEFKPTDTLNLSLSYNKSRLTRDDTGLVAYDSNIFSVRSTYQFSRFVSLKARLDYNTLSSRVFGQYTFAWTPSPGKALYVGYNDNWNYKGYAYGQNQPGFLQLNRTFFIKMSYLFRKSL